MRDEVGVAMLSEGRPKARSSSVVSSKGFEWYREMLVNILMTFDVLNSLNCYAQM